MFNVKWKITPTVNDTETINSTFVVPAGKWAEFTKYTVTVAISTPYRAGIFDNASVEIITNAVPSGGKVNIELYEDRNDMYTVGISGW